MFQYHMVQVPPNVNVKSGQTQNAAADYLMSIVGHHAQQGWEFYSIETIGVIENPGCGCLGALFGVQATIRQHYVIVFRRQAAVMTAPPRQP